MVKEVESPDDKNRICKDMCEDLMKNISRLPLKDDPELQKKVRKAWRGQYKEE